MSYVGGGLRRFQQMTYDLDSAQAVRDVVCRAADQSSHRLDKLESTIVQVLSKASATRTTRKIHAQTAVEAKRNSWNDPNERG